MLSKKNFILAIASALVWFVGISSADLCGLGSTEIDGNYFCQPVTNIQYSNVGTPGSYNRITYMGSDGTCSSVPQSFSGPTSPLDGEVSFHVRGPAHLNEFAVYVPSTSSNSKRSTAYNHLHKHGRNNAYTHSHGRAQGEVKGRQEVTATIDGKVVSWGNDYWGPSSVPASEVMVTATIDGQVVSWTNNWFGSSASATTSATIPASYPVASLSSPQPGNTVETPMPTTLSTVSVPTSSSANGIQPPPTGPGFEAAGTFERLSYYHAESETVDNVVFLGNYGGQGSGVFDENFGASLAYANSAGTGGAATPQVLANQVIPSGSEVIIMRGDNCNDGGCGYSRPGAIAHHGFDGADKVFMFDFSMPMDGEGGFEGDMPAIWLLNADIPRTVQYGHPECNCWTSGCGEFDIAEALYDGSSFLKSTLHTNTPAGDSDYIVRPTTTSIKLAVVFSANTSTINIQVLDSETEFPVTMSAEDINNLCQEAGGTTTSHFHVSG